MKSIFSLILTSKFFIKLFIHYISYQNVKVQCCRQWENYVLCICCAQSSDLPSLKTGLSHVLTILWSEDGLKTEQFRRWGRWMEDGARWKVLENICFTKECIQTLFITWLNNWFKRLFLSFQRY